MTHGASFIRVPQAQLQTSVSFMLVPRQASTGAGPSDQERRATKRGESWLLWLTGALL